MLTWPSGVVDNADMTRPTARGPRGRPRSSPLPRTEQLRLAKQAQRARDRAAGQVLCQVKVTPSVSERLRQGLQLPGFEADLARFLAEQLIDVREFPELAGLCWNRSERFLPAREALSLYERNWRFVDRARLTASEAALIERLVQRYGNGVLNV